MFIHIHVYKMLYGLVVFISLTFVNCVMLFGLFVGMLPTDGARVTRGTDAVWRKTAAIDAKVNLLPAVPFVPVTAVVVVQRLHRQLEAHYSISKLVTKYVIM